MNKRPVKVTVTTIFEDGSTMSVDCNVSSSTTFAAMTPASFVNDTGNSTMVHSRQPPRQAPTRPMETNNNPLQPMAQPMNPQKKRIYVPDDLLDYDPIDVSGIDHDLATSNNNNQITMTSNVPKIVTGAPAQKKCACGLPADKIQCHKMEPDKNGVYHNGQWFWKCATNRCRYFEWEPMENHQ